MDMHSAIRSVARGVDLDREQMNSVMRIVMQGDATPAQIGAFLTALHIKGETVDELTAAAIVMREFAAAVSVRSDKVVDTVGTGGDAAGLFNVSTACALVAAAAGITVAKHGNRAATGKSGSADVLEAAGVYIGLTPDQVGETIDHVGIGFMFAPTHHGATRHAVGPRREIGVRTIFNLLGPLTNPAAARWQLVGVYEQRWLRPLAEVFGNLGSIHTLVVSSSDGLDEISIADSTPVCEFYKGELSEFVISPEDYGIERQALSSIKVESASESLALIHSALSGEKGPAYDMVALNAGATLYAADVVISVGDGVDRARAVLDAGDAVSKLEELAAYTQRFG
ncbi:MAG: anthranilate phosphoribosyltransferase [Acidiferrobacteraceae bacterium]|nr:anthranilate phosphoribosyltransferase [Acidiferrobacteraceae bacterium]